MVGVHGGHLTPSWSAVREWNERPDVSKDIAFAAETFRVREGAIVSQLSS